MPFALTFIDENDTCASTDVSASFGKTAGKYRTAGKNKKSGGSSPFRRIKGCAATTPQNALSMVVSVKKVVAVAALLQNSGKGG